MEIKNIGAHQLLNDSLSGDNLSAKNESPRKYAKDVLVNAKDDPYEIDLKVMMRAFPGPKQATGTNTCNQTCEGCYQTQNGCYGTQNSCNQTGCC